MKALAHFAGLKHFFGTYDVGCQYYKKLGARLVANGLIQDESELPDIIFRLGLFHMQAHKESCQGLFGLTHTEGAGLMDGENVERVWAGNNGTATATAQMSIGHRQDIINECFAGWNWRKVLDRRKYSSYSYPI